MRTFSCDACGNTLFFENDTCLKCGSQVGFRADELTMATSTARRRAASRLAAIGRSGTPAIGTRRASRAGQAGYCLACSCDEVVPDLSDPQRFALWTETERAKRRLDLYAAHARVAARPSADKRGLRFRLLADERVDTGAVEPPAHDAVVIGHDEGR